MVDNWSAYQKAFFSGALDDRYGWYVAYSDGRLIDAAQTRAMLRERLRTHPEERFMIIEVGQKHPTALETIRTLQRADVFSVLRRFIITCGYLFGILLILIKAPLIALLAAALGPHIAYLLIDPRNPLVRQYEKRQLLLTNPVRNYWAVQAIESVEMSRTLSEMRIYRAIDDVKRR